MGFYSVTCQLAPNTCPIELLTLGVKQNRNETIEADAAVFDRVIGALGLTDTSPSQLLVAVMIGAISLEEIKAEIVGRSIRNGRNSCALAIMREAYEIWAAGVGEDGADYLEEEEL